MKRLRYALEGGPSNMQEHVVGREELGQVKWRLEELACASSYCPGMYLCPNCTEHRTPSKS